MTVLNPSNLLAYYCAIYFCQLQAQLAKFVGGKIIYRQTPLLGTPETAALVSQHCALTFIDWRIREFAILINVIYMHQSASGLQRAIINLRTNASNRYLLNAGRRDVFRFFLS